MAFSGGAERLMTSRNVAVALVMVVVSATAISVRCW
jgi:hypothetical protein